MAKKNTPPCCEKAHPRVGDRVWVVRTEHGWFDGALEAVVTHVTHGSTGGVSYGVKDDEGGTHFCPKRGDVRRMGGDHG